MSVVLSGAAPSTPITSAFPRTDSQSQQPPGSAALALLQLQADLRKTKNANELGYFVANEARTALRAQQVVVYGPGIAGALSVQTVSSLTNVDRSSPLVLWFESVPRQLANEKALNKIREFEAPALAGEFTTVVSVYPLRHMAWVPWLSREGDVIAGMLLARATPWSQDDLKLASYLSGAFAHARSAFGLTGKSRLLTTMMSRRVAGIVAACLAVTLAVPVPMSALAPVEIVPKETAIVTTGIDGIVEEVAVEPNARVEPGQTLVKLDDTTLRNRAEIAEREVLLADSRYKKAAQLAFVDSRGRHEMAIARSELDLKLAERDYARELLSRTEIRATRAGVAFFADKKDLIGKPVVVGEKLMEVADPGASEFRIELPASDAIVLRDGAKVKVFLDSDPLRPVDARLVRAAYKAAPREAQQFSFRLVAAPIQQDASNNLRLGMRGTAQIYSDNVPLGFYLFRRPIAAARQWSGL